MNNDNNFQNSNPAPPVSPTIQTPTKNPPVSKHNSKLPIILVIIGIIELLSSYYIFYGLGLFTKIFTGIPDTLIVSFLVICFLACIQIIIGILLFFLHSKIFYKASQVILIGTLFLMVVLIPLSLLYSSRLSSETALLPTPKGSIKTSPTPALSTTDSTTNWKLYTNSFGKYQISFPADYTINVGKSVGVDGVATKQSDSYIELISKTLPNTSGNIKISINSSVTSVKTAHEVAASAGCGDISNKSGVSYSLGGTNGLIFENTSCGPWGITVIDTVNNGRAYSISIEGNVDYKVIKPIYDRILSTFTFAPLSASKSTNLTPTPTCMPRPACLDSNPRCMIAEPANGWCRNTEQQNQTSCTTNADCQSGSTCMTTGPLIAGQTPKKVCSQPGVANPL